MTGKNRCELCGKIIVKSAEGVFIAPTAGWYSISTGYNGEGTKLILAHFECVSPEKEKQMASNKLWYNVFTSQGLL